MVSPSGVSINVDLRIKDALAKIAILQGALRSLDDEDIGIDDSIAESLEDIEFDPEDVLEDVDIEDWDVDSLDDLNIDDSVSVESAIDKDSVESGEVSDSLDDAVKSSLLAGGAQEMGSLDDEDIGIDDSIAESLEDMGFDPEDVLEDVDIEDWDVDSLDDLNIDDSVSVESAIDKDSVESGEVSDSLDDAVKSSLLAGAAQGMGSGDGKDGPPGKSPFRQILDEGTIDSAHINKVEAISADRFDADNAEVLNAVLSEGDFSPSEILTPNAATSGVSDKAAREAIVEGGMGMDFRRLASETDLRWNEIFGVDQEEFTQGGTSGFLEQIQSFRQRRGAGLSRTDAFLSLGANKKVADTEIGKGDALDTIENAVKRVLPTNMRKWYNLIAFLLPVMITLIGLFLGVAAAIGSVAVAGAGLLGLGLVGWGERLEDSMHVAQMRIKQLKRELFEVIQAPAGQFTQFQDQIFGMLPGEVSRLNDSLRDLDQFEPYVDRALRGIIGFIDEVLEGMTDLADTLGPMALTFGNLLGRLFQRFGRFIIDFIDESGQHLIEFGATLRTLMTALFEFSQVFAAVLTAFRPLFDFLNWLGDKMSGTIAMSVLSATAAFWALAKAQNAALAQFAAFNVSKAAAGLLIFLDAWYKKSLMAAAATMNLKAAVMSLSLALLKYLAPLMIAAHILRSMSNSMGDDLTAGEPFAAGGGGPAVGKGRTVVNNNDVDVNIQGDVDQPTEQSIRDTVNSEIGIGDFQSY